MPDLQHAVDAAFSALSDLEEAVEDRDARAAEADAALKLLEPFTAVLAERRGAMLSINGDFVLVMEDGRIPFVIPIVERDD